jgi:cytochrome c peroxidase
MIDSSLVSKAIAQFLRTMISYRSRYDQVLQGQMKFNNYEYEGFVLVNEQTKADCIHCHNTDGSVLATSMAFSNNGLDKISDPEKYPDKGRGGVTGHVADNGKFRIPSLRNLVFTAPYMHDGRFKTLEEVLNFYSEGVQQSVNADSKMEFAHKGGAALTKEEKQKIMSFLLTLSDSAFVTDTAFGSPFK